MRLLCFLAAQPAPLHHAVITQWLPNDVAYRGTCNPSETLQHIAHMTCYESETHAGSRNALKPLFVRTVIL